jgi:membrane protease subunit (stomatin/prohibitin family)
MKAGRGAVNSALADQWLELISADSLGGGILIQRGRARSKQSTRAGESSNTKGSADVITRGTKLIVADGQALLIVENGAIVDFTTEPGEYIFDSSSEPSMFLGKFGESLVDTFRTAGKRFAYGGDTANKQVAYYVNVKEIVGNKFGSAQPMAYDDRYYGTVLYIRYFGVYSFKIIDPLRFYASIAGNVRESYTAGELSEQSDTEFYTALDTSLGKLAVDGVKFSQLTSKQSELANIMSDALDDAWRHLRGIEIVRVGINKITPDDKSRERIEQFDRSRMIGENAAVARGRILDAQATMFENLGNREDGASGADMMGAMVGMMGVNMMNQQMQNAQGGANFAQATQGGIAASNPAQNPDAWTCSCGTENDGKFCKECGKPKP